MVKNEKIRKQNKIIDTTESKQSFALSRKNGKPTSGAGIFKNVVSQTKKHIRNLKPKCKKMLTELAYAAAREFATDLPIKLPRVIPIPKTGGFLPLIPIFAGLSATGSLSGGVAGITKAVNDYRAAKKQLTESKRHNTIMDALCIGKGLHLKPYKNGLGIYVTKKKN